MLRKHYPSSLGPADISVNLAKAYKVKRMGESSAARVAGDLRTLSAIWNKWFARELGLLSANPWAEVEAPKVDKKHKRLIKDSEKEKFFAWLAKRYEGWRLPVLFFEVKASIGCRISELAGLGSDRLREGRLWFPGEETKGRKERPALLPVALFQELKAIAGPTYVWERYTEDLRRHYLKLGGRHRRHALNLKGFAPERLVRFLQDAVTKFRALHPDIPKFVCHNFRGTAMSKAKEAGVSYEAASIAFDCHIQTMKDYYVEFDESKVADEVFRKIQGGGIGGELVGKNRRSSK